MRERYIQFGSPSIYHLVMDIGGLTNTKCGIYCEVDWKTRKLKGLVTKAQTENLVPCKSCFRKPKPPITPEEMRAAKKDLKSLVRSLSRM